MKCLEVQPVFALCISPISCIFFWSYDTIVIEIGILSLWLVFDAQFLQKLQKLTMESNAEIVGSYFLILWKFHRMSCEFFIIFSFGGHQVLMDALSLGVSNQSHEAKHFSQFTDILRENLINVIGEKLNSI